MGEYSVTITNRFALSVDEDEDLHELLEKQQKEKKTKEEQAAEAAKAAAAKGKSDKKGSAKGSAKRAPVKQADNKPAPQQPAKSYPRNDENRPPRFAKQARDGGDHFEKPPQTEGFGGRGRRGGFARGGRGAPRGGGFGGRPAKREFERHSGSDKTGVKPTEKREGSGPHNWGDEIEAQLEQPEPQTESTTEAETPVTNENHEPEPVGVEEPKVMTLDEWKASQTKSKTEFKVRKANEGADSKQWKGTVALQKKKKGDASDEEDVEEDDEEPGVDETRANLEKLNIEITFADNSSRAAPRPRGRGGRGGRGGSFGGRGGPRSGRGGRGGFPDMGNDGGRMNVPRVDNESEFPSLGGR